MRPLLCCFLFVSCFVSPISLFGQTSGATAPEVTQFEPVDTTDLVNLATGDFSYSIPAMVIPGAPGGAYPLALSYHAGIRYNQEASWVGLGWNLTPGQIQRSVRGLPDDWKSIPIERFERFEDIYSYSVGLGVAQFTAGVNYSTHSGFGGSVYYGIQNSPVSAGFSSQGGYQLSINQSDQFLGASMSYGAKAGFSGNLTSGRLGLSYAQGSGVGLSMPRGKDGFSVSATKEGFSVSGARGSSVSAFSSTLNSGTGYSTKTSGISLPIPVGGLNFTLGYQKTVTTRKQKNRAYGYLHLPNVSKDHAQPFNEDLDVRIDLDTNDDPQFIDLDFYSQDYQAQFNKFHYNYNIANNINSDFYGDNQAFEADVIQAAIDGYSVSAQGVGGNLRPVLKQRGWIKPSGPGISRSLGGDYTFRPYSSMYQKILDSSDSRWDSVRSLFADYYAEGWRKHNEQDADERVMVFLEDQGYQENTRFYLDGDDLGSSYYPMLDRIEHRSRKVTYELNDPEGWIQTIRVTQADGLTYIFGRHNSGGRDYGAAPMVTHEFAASKVSDAPEGDEIDPDSAGDDKLFATTTKKGRYPYAWYLAAVITPDYYDVTDDGYTADDWGRWITFEYAVTSHGYSWEIPWQHDRGVNSEYLFTGISGNRDRNYFFERTSGTKELFIPYRAETGTHVALFDFRNPTPRLDARSAGPHPGMKGDHGENYFSEPVQGRLVLPSGLIQQENLTLNQNLTVEAFLVSANPPGSTTMDIDLFYQGDYADGRGSLFHYTLAPNLMAADITPETTTVNGSGMLNNIQLYTRASYDTLVAANTTSENTLDWPAILDNTDYQAKVAFDYSYALGAGMPNSAAPDGGRLTLEEVNFYAQGDRRTQPPFTFSYHDDPADAGEQVKDYYHRDPWGFYSSISTKTASLVEERFLQDGSTPIQALWSLSSIETPIGTVIDIAYEQDRYSFVQDRIAVNFDYDRASAQMFHNFTPVSKNEAAYAGQTFTIPSGYSQDYARMVVQALTPSVRFSAAREFIIPLKSAGGSSFSLNPGQKLTDLLVYVNRFPTTGITLYPVAARFDPNNAVTFFQEANDQSSGSLQHLIDSKVIALPGLSGNPLFVLQDVKTFLTGFQFDMNGFWKDQAVVTAAYTTDRHASSSPPTYHQSFILPLTHISGTTYRFDAEHPALEELATWLIYRNWVRGEGVTDSGQPKHQVLGLQLNPLPPSTHPDFPAMVSQGGLAGVAAGGIRVKSLTMSSATDPNDTYKMNYFYTNPSSWTNGDPTQSGFDSGVIFVDPPLAVSGIEGGDRRIIRAEEHPYHNSLGAQVYYEYVSTQRDSPTHNMGITTYHFATPKHPLVYQPFGVGLRSDTFQTSVRGIEQYKTESPNISALYQSSEVDKIRYQNNQWEEADYGSDVTFRIENEVRKEIRNNMGLVGKPLTITHTDNASPIRKVRESIFSYKGNHENAPGVKTFSLDKGYLEESWVNKPLAVQVEKSQALVLGFVNHVTDTYRGNILMVDEVFNAFREDSLTQIDYSYVPNPDPQASGDLQQAVTRETVNLAYDYYTGQTVLNRMEVRGNGNDEEYFYNLSIPAHYLQADVTSPSSMRKRNMFTQEGYNLTAIFPANSGGMGLPTEYDFLGSLAGRYGARGGRVVHAAYHHWNQAGNTPNEVSWVRDASFDFVHLNEDSMFASTPKTQLGWLHPYQAWPTEAGSPNLLKLDVAAPSGGGRWIAAGQNTKFDHRLNVLEYRDLQDTFSAAVYIDDGQRVAANFANAQYNQIYYEGFENPENVTQSGLYANTFDDTISLSDTLYMQNFAQVYAGTHSFQGVYVIDMPNGNAYGGAVDDNRNNYLVGFFVQKGSTPYAIQLLNSGGGSLATIDLSLEQHSQALTVMEVENGWVYVCADVGSASQVQIDAGSRFIDEITAYPAPSGAPDQATYRSGGRVTLAAYHPHHKQVMSITDERGRTLRFRHDGRGQLFKVYDSRGRVGSEHYRAYHGEDFNSSSQ